jgi:hypothetical protein
MLQPDEKQDMGKMVNSASNSVRNKRVFTIRYTIRISLTTRGKEFLTGA